MDDTLDLPWRVKILLPAAGAGPLLSTYSGSTALVVPAFLRFLLAEGGVLTAVGLGHGSALLAALGVHVEDADGALVELGLWFYLLMGLLVVFCANAINIYAGVNGIEAGQSYVIGVVILLLNIVQIYLGEEVADATLSATLVLPFIGVTAGLLRHNWYPAQVFVGDTFCYFAGMTIAVCAIHGHYAKTLALVLAPQLFNFAISLPQLFKLVPCPRHRLPRVDPETQLLQPSTFTLKAGTRRLVRLLALVPSAAEEVPNFTIICVALRVLGPLRERSLVVALLALQLLVGVGAIFVRYHLSGICYNSEGGYNCS
uniref:UDP-N-acetylglucosamine--dolichyl-phosphate N-acetylglucosaminephosphotransferase n=2 Tax=Phaeomonas parva TaxID=124430 RepID=A0A7S1Y0C5_9STRA|mmetsp:Transcript_6745/g.19405  ORF Transcript_6745/g.19405 Transcript_6745/m.19405 type:complete len:314 (+) Transcript_6745:414-1355(+)